MRRVGIAWAKELVCSGANLKADEAQRIGLVNRVFEPEELGPKSLEAAQTIATNGPEAVQLAKRVIQDGQGADIRVAHQLEQSAFGLAFASSVGTDATSALEISRQAERAGFDSVWDRRLLN